MFDPIVNGQAEIAGVPAELLDQFSKRAREIDVEMGDKLADFLDREGRDPSGFEYATMEREAAVDTRTKKSGLGVGSSSSAPTPRRTCLSLSSGSMTRHRAGCGPRACCGGPSGAARSP
jgi:hypothetical protein